MKEEWENRKQHKVKLVKVNTQGGILQFTWQTFLPVSSLTPLRIMHHVRYLKLEPCICLKTYLYVCVPVDEEQVCSPRDRVMSKEAWKDKKKAKTLGMHHLLLWCGNTSSHAHVCILVAIHGYFLFSFWKGKRVILLFQCILYSCSKVSILHTILSPFASLTLGCCDVDGGCAARKIHQWCSWARMLNDKV